MIGCRTVSSLTLAEIWFATFVTEMSQYILTSLLRFVNVLLAFLRYLLYDIILHLYQRR